MNLAIDYNFSNVCYQNCTLGGQTLAQLGIVDITNTLANGGQNQPVDTNLAFNSNQPGKYLVVSGRLNDDDDYFKLNKLVATLMTKPPGQTPEPGTLAIMGLGLLGLLSVRRRRQAA